MMEPPRQPVAPPDELQPAEQVEAKEPPRGWQTPARWNYWAKLDPLEFARYPALKPLPYLEESRLFQRAQRGDIDARNTLWAQHLRLAFSVVNRFHLPPALLADALQEAAIGLVSAIDRFEVHRYVAFSTYAWYRMEQRVRRFQTENRYAARIPAYLYTEYQRFRVGRHRCRSRADLFDWREEWLSAHPKIFDRLSRFHGLAYPRPLDDAADLACPHPGPGEATEESEVLKLIAAAIDALPRRKHHIIIRRYGLDGEPEQTLGEIGDTLDLTRERVRQLQNNAEVALREKLRRHLAGSNGRNRENSAS